MSASASFPLRQNPHPAAIRWMHWIVAGAVLMEFLLALTRMGSESTSLRAMLLTWHQACGLLIGALTVSRLGIRLRLHLSAWQGPRWMAWTSSLLHGASYLLLVALPALGLALVNARGRSVSLPGLGQLPPLIGRDLELADLLEDWHETLAWTLLALIGLHVAAALWHQFIRRDGLLDAIGWRRA